MLFKILCNARRCDRWSCRIASGFLLLLGVLTHAKSDPRVDQETAPAPTEAAASEGVDNGAEPVDALVEERGVASWYGRRPWRGRHTASGARFDDRALTAAHLWLPFATRARVTNLQNGRSVDVVVTDRGPYHEGRIIDLSAKAAEALGIKRCGIADVVVSAQFWQRETEPVSVETR